MKASSYQSGYRDLELIHDGKKCRIFRGLRETDLRPVILKATREYPSPKDVSGFRHEYEITKNLDIDGIVRILGIEDFQSGVALIEEDFDGRSLRKYLAEGPLELADVLSIGIKLADILSELHNHHREPRSGRACHGMVEFMRDMGIAAVTRPAASPRERHAGEIDRPKLRFELRPKACRLRGRVHRLRGMRHAR